MAARPPNTLDPFAEAKLRALDKRRLRRTLEITDRVDTPHAVRNGRRLVSFSCNDYLGLSHEARVIDAAVAATRRYGTGAGASRLVTGNHPLHCELEQRLAALKGSEQAVVFGSGYLTSIGVVPALAGPRDLIVMDELCHACLISGASLSRAQVLTFRHNDIDAAAAILAAQRGKHRHCLLVTEGVFSMDGDLAPLPGLAALAERYDAWLLMDDAHAVGVIGSGRGAAFATDPPASIPLQIGTLSKALGAYGGYLCASASVAQLIRNRAPSFVYSTGLPPGTVAAAIAAVDIVATEPARVALPLERARLFTSALGLPPAASAIVPIVLGKVEKALAASEALEAAGFLVTPIRPPTVPPGTARLRVAVSAAHRPEDVRAAANAVAPYVDPRFVEPE